MHFAPALPATPIVLQFVLLGASAWGFARLVKLIKEVSMKDLIQLCLYIISFIGLLFHLITKGRIVGIIGYLSLGIASIMQIIKKLFS